MPGVSGGPGGSVRGNKMPMGIDGERPAARGND